MVKEKIKVFEELNASDRCDRCGARAYVLATINQTDLLFCSHHYQKHKEAIDKVAIWVHDETHKLG